jgi:uncharacterized protein (TIGR00290 family)
VEVVGLMTTVNRSFERVAIHAVRCELLDQQAQAAGLPLYTVELPSACSNAQYEAAMSEFVDHAKTEEIKHIAFGDLFLADVRAYREATLSGTGIVPLFPLWQSPTNELAREMIESGLRAMVTCVDPKQLGADFVGREFNRQFLSDLPAEIDPCGERGEFHTFAFDGPMFSEPISIELGEIVSRDGFIYADLLPAQKITSNASVG